MTKSAKILLPYENKWVAISKRQNEVIAFAKDVRVLSNKLEKMKIKKGDAILTWVFPFKQAITHLMPKWFKCTYHPYIAEDPQTGEKIAVWRPIIPIILV